MGSALQIPIERMDRMFCPKCGNQVKDNAKFCPKCGTMIKERPQQKGEEESLPPKQTENEKKGKGPIILLFIIVLIFLIAAVIMFVGYLGKRGEKDIKLSTSLESVDDRADETDIIFEADTLGVENRGEEETAEPDSTAVAAAVPSAGGMSETPMQITWDVIYSSNMNFNGLQKVPVMKENVTQSSSVVQENSKIDNTGWSAFDGQSITSWQEGVDGDGIGEYISAQFDRVYQVKAITFLLGNHRSEDWYVKNNRPKSLELNLGGNSYSVDFPDEMKEFAVVFSSPVLSSDVTITIKSVYNGTEYTDTVISEIGIYGG